MRSRSDSTIKSSAESIAESNTNSNTDQASQIHIIASGVSDALLADFEALKETPSQQGLKYHASTIDHLARYICCRNYSSLTLELSYLCWAIINYRQQDNSLLHYFWLDEAITPSKVRQYFTEAEKATWLPRNTSIQLNDLGLRLGFEQREFVISATRVSILSAFLELLCTHFCSILDEIQAALLGRKEADIKLQASHLQKQIYQWLKDHLPTAQLQQRYRYLEQWQGTNEISTAMSNQDILMFWQDSFEQEGYVKYTTAVDDVLAYELASLALKYSHEAQYGVNLDQYAELICNDEQVLYEACAFAGDNYSQSALTGSPKFMTAKQYQAIEPLMTCSKIDNALTLTAFRYAVFGQWQNQLIQSRRVATQTSSQKSKTSTNSLIEAPENDYAEYTHTVNDIVKVNKLAILSCIAILYEKNDLACMSLLSDVIADILPAEQSQVLAEFVNRLFSESQSKSTSSVMSLIKQARLQHPVLNKAFVVAQQALSKNNKKGFNDFELFDAPIYTEGAGKLSYLNRLLLKCLSSIENEYPVTLSGTTDKTASSDDGMHEKFLSDLSIFTIEFGKRHAL